MTTTAQTQASTTFELEPYIFFYGRCEEALEFYKNVLGGTYDLQRTADTPMAEHVSPEFRNKVMHASFRAPGLAFMASDGREAKPVDPEAGNISLALAAHDRATGDRVFKALAEGGEVKMPLDEAFWGGRFGMLHDRFGLEWMITTP
jgi:PhnB protein